MNVLQPIAQLAAGVERRLLEPTPAWPFSAFRACAALIALFWFAHHPPAVRALACALCVAMIMGWLPRLCASLLLVAATALPRHGAASGSLDDYCVALLLFWSALLPLGPTLRELAYAQARAARAEGLSRHACLASFALLYLNVGAWASYPPFENGGRWPAVLLATVPALFVLSGRTRLRWLVVAGQLAVHSSLLIHTGASFTQLALAATALLVPGDLWPATAPAQPPAPRSPVRVGTASALAAAYVAIVLLVIAAQLLDGQSFIAKSDELLSDVGLPVRYLLLGAK